ncbi:hypothetical protein ACFLZX_01240 [Nanoarchaeota archaeon]
MEENDEYEREVEDSSHPENPSANPNARVIDLHGPGVSKFILIVVIVAAVLAISITAYVLITHAECGNGKVERGETEDTCCTDVGCRGEQTCENNSCIDPTCSECQYYENFICNDYTCCSDSGCDDNDPDTKETCVDPSKKISKCESQLLVKLKTTTSPFSLTKEMDASFEFEKKDYTLSISEPSSTSVIVDIEGTKTTIKKGDKKNIDIDDDSIADISLELTNSSSDSASFKIKKLTYACFEDSDCDDNEAATTDKCVDAGSPSSKCTNEIINECEDHSDCDDNDDTTDDYCVGTPKKCQHTGVEECKDDDGFCPSDCNYVNDDDCPKTTIDCGKNIQDLEEDDDMPKFECFVEASEVCAKATLTNTVIEEEDGIITEKKYSMEIKGNDTIYCAFEHEIINVKLEFSDDLIQEKLDNGSTQAEIDQEEADMEEDAQAVEGDEVSCNFEYDDLEDLLNDWMNGRYEDDDLDIDECEEV